MKQTDHVQTLFPTTIMLHVHNLAAIIPRLQVPVVTAIAKVISWVAVRRAFSEPQLNSKAKVPIASSISASEFSVPIHLKPGAVVVDELHE